MNYCSMRFLAGFGVLLLGCPALFHAAPLSSTVSTEDKILAKGYIGRYYSNFGLTNPSPRRISKRSFTEGLRSMQSFYGLTVTGAVNNETLEVMKRRRCGVPDISHYEHYSGRPKWKKKLLTYRITVYTPDLAQETVDATIAQAFKLYSDVVPLDFKQIYSGSADIMMFFASGDHGDFYPFDGEGGELAHANHPGKSQGGFVHFDEDETWTVTSRDTNLLLVAAHEIGHTLGLEHSEDTSALLFPDYRYVNTNGYKLPDDDRRGVQALYGPREKPTPEPEKPTEDPFPSPEDEQCNRTLVFDAATSFREDLFFFKNGYYWRKSAKSIDLTKVNSKWSEISFVDAAYEVPLKNVVYLFEGTHYWGIKADSETVMSGYPKPLTDLGLPPSVTHVDAAVYESTTKKTFIFFGSQYWSYDEGSNQMDPGYPRDIKKYFPGVGSRVDAAFENYGNLFLSSGHRQSEFNVACRTVMRVLLNYGWLECY